MKGKHLTDYYSVREVAEKLSISRQGVLYLIDTDQLPVFFIDNYYCIKSADLDKFIQSRQHSTDQRIKAR